MKAWILMFLMVAACTCSGEAPPWPTIPAAERKQIDECSMRRTLRECLWEYPTTRRFMFGCPYQAPCYPRHATAYYIRDRARLAGRTD